jgi:hypothetical protein
MLSPCLSYSQVFREECLIYMVLEYGDIDLARLLQNHEEARRRQLASGGTAAAGKPGMLAALTCSQSTAPSQLSYLKPYKGLCILMPVYASVYLHRSKAGTQQPLPH